MPIRGLLGHLGRIIMMIMPMSTRDRSKPRILKLEVLDDDMVRVLSTKTGAERLSIAAGLFRSARRMILSHLREEHPDWDAAKLQTEVARRLSHGTG